jgi:ribosomal-protein-alanine N-acetyltransferase
VPDAGVEVKRAPRSRPGPTADEPAVVAPLTSADAGLGASIDALARESFGDPSFSLKAELERPWTRAWLATTNDLDAPAGFAVAWHVADELHVLNVAVAPEVRRRGVGTRLMSAALAYAEEKRVRIVLLEVRRSNRPALRLYRSLGFSVLGVRPRYYGDNDEDAVEMILSLDPATGATLPGRDEIHV